jgi:hypothetical protein
MLRHERLAGIFLLAGGVLAFSAGAFAAESANAAAGGAWADPAKTICGSEGPAAEVVYPFADR